MSSVVLRKALVRNVTLKLDSGRFWSTKHVARDPLYARKCDYCGRPFKMTGSSSSGIAAGQCKMLFYPTPGTNFAALDICSAPCLVYLLEKEEWRGASAVEDLALTLETKVTRYELHITDDVQFEEELVRKWEDTPERQPSLKHEYHAEVYED